MISNLHLRVNTKLTDGSEWYDLFNNAAEDRALFLLPQSEQGQKEKMVWENHMNMKIGMQLMCFLFMVASY